MLWIILLASLLVVAIVIFVVLLLTMNSTSCEQKAPEPRGLGTASPEQPDIRSNEEEEVANHPGSRLETILNDDNPELQIYVPPVLTKQPNGHMVLCIVTPTYYRANGTTLGFLERTAQVLQNQSYTNWRWYIIGDCYEQESELFDFASRLNDNRVILYNMPEPGERGIVDAERLWAVAGGTANNNGIDMLLADGHDWYVHMDDDDIWSGDHLQTLVYGIQSEFQPNFVYTQAQYRSCPFPRCSYTDVTDQVPPRPKSVIHSSICFNARVLPQRYDRESQIPGDADLYVQMSKDSRWKPVLVPNVTVYHLEERGSETSTGFGFAYKLCVGKRSVPRAGFLNLDTVQHSTITQGAVMTHWNLERFPYPLQANPLTGVIIEDCLDNFDSDVLYNIFTELRKSMLPNMPIRVCDSSYDINALQQLLTACGYQDVSIVNSFSSQHCIFKITNISEDRLCVEAHS